MRAGRLWTYNFFEYDSIDKALFERTPELKHAATSTNGNSCIYTQVRSTITEVREDATHLETKKTKKKHKPSPVPQIQSQCENKAFVCNIQAPCARGERDETFPDMSLS